MKGWKRLVTMMENSLLLWHELPGTPDSQDGYKNTEGWGWIRETGTR